LFRWIAKHYGKGAEVASLCVGAFMLAKTGILAGKKCSTHWLAADEFRKMFPDVDLQTDRIITEEQGILHERRRDFVWNLLLYWSKIHRPGNRCFDRQSFRH
jgi:putative intracellular protease/amidase